MKIDLKVIPSGHACGNFLDAARVWCVLQEDVTSTDILCLGPGGAFMHLTRDHAATLIPLLQHFAEHGKLPRPEVVHVADVTQAYLPPSARPSLCGDPAPARSHLGLDGALRDKKDGSTDPICRRCLEVAWAAMGVAP